MGMQRRESSPAGRRIIAIIPARGGSKGIKRKNLQLLGGRPLVAWPILVAKQAGMIDKIIVSTDDPEIALVARESGADVDIRPAHLAGDAVIVADVLRDLRSRLRAEGEGADIAVLLEPTAPFRSPAMIRDCLDKLLMDGHDSSATFRECQTNPHRAWKLEHGIPKNFINGANPWLPRQQLPKAYQISGEVYAFSLDLLSPSRPSLLLDNPAAVIIDAEYSVDIDGTMELELARLLFPHSPLANLG